jgi:putative ATPase
MTQLWQRKVKGCDIAVVQADITTESVDAVVNAANERLKLGAGVAGAIKRAGGPTIQAECDAIVATRGIIKTGQAVMTGAGALPARHVIHAVGPAWGSGDEAAKLACAVNAVLNLCRQNGLASVSLPAISSGVYGFPKELCAGTMFDALEQWLDQPAGQPLKTIRLCNIDEATARVFEREARRRFG